jgi:thiol-disulfide isomerase/thioredoxin
MRTRRLVAVSSFLLLSAIAGTGSAAELPRKSPEFVINMNAGKPLLLSSYRGKPVVLAFILTYCSHCQLATGFLIKDQNEFGPKGLQVLECAIEEAAQTGVPGFLKRFNPPFPVGFNTNQDAVFEYLQHSMTVGPQMPILVFIDKDGMIRSQYEGNDPFIKDETKEEQNIHAEIEKLMKFGGPAKKSAPKKSMEAVKKSN